MLSKNHDYKSKLTNCLHAVESLKPSVAQLLKNFPTFYITILSQMNPVNTTQSFLSKIHFSIILLPASNYS
jgi:hypothetical protein